MVLPRCDPRASSLDEKAPVVYEDNAAADEGHFYEGPRHTAQSGVITTL
jgi:hypothetical protein